jgi:hypothetical protein
VPRTPHVYTDAVIGGVHALVGHIVRDKRGVVAVNRGGRVEQDGEEIFLDVSDLRCVFSHAVKGKLNVITL